eukprot:CAMPEP_0174751646 /NCGR_PEP_ID=MMETSP1094-20130205/100296_1 /TAXON_ID=156173 /ORGANISM="Chrysochromulina brevifilum, Strain UTEX LB 985" /LENGTH=70 /DNA_ID=CAMNT_0015957171 /DNA_START=1 /DNA_END=210 /DNA_ORIENTATION=-
MSTLPGPSDIPGPFENGGTSTAVNDWATSVAILNAAVLKLSQISQPAVVYRGVREDSRKLPDIFLPARFV